MARCMGLTYRLSTGSCAARILALPRELIPILLIFTMAEVNPKAYPLVRSLPWVSPGLVHAPELVTAPSPPFRYRRTPC